MVVKDKAISSELRGIANSHLTKEMRSKLKALWGSEDYVHSARCALVNYLSKNYNVIEEDIKLFEKKGGDGFFLRNKLDLVNGKIKFFQAYLTKEEFYKAHSLLESIRKELISNV